ncbi:Hypothetical predicted protein [Xyrichtys novacula]|uniref:Uncharacterized protein n=1 Tax=Xyrichtys novacula TaxID=13765 RepID=A0AAV1FZ23_XYRNO|nr:Hypothetical predicted protein [Xyrichtys novacula]
MVLANNSMLDWESVPVTMTLLDRHLLRCADDPRTVADFKKTVSTSLKTRMDPANTEKQGEPLCLLQLLIPATSTCAFSRRMCKMQRRRQPPDEEASGSGAGVMEPRPSQPKKRKMTLSAFFGDDDGESSADDELGRYAQYR